MGGAEYALCQCFKRTKSTATFFAEKSSHVDNHPKKKDIGRVTSSHEHLTFDL